TAEQLEPNRYVPWPRRRKQVRGQARHWEIVPQSLASAARGLDRSTHAPSRHGWISTGARPERHIESHLVAALPPVGSIPPLHVPDRYVGIGSSDYCCPRDGPDIGAPALHRSPLHDGDRASRSRNNSLG